jgi:hypothetical protein
MLVCIPLLNIQIKLLEKNRFSRRRKMKNLDFVRALMIGVVVGAVVTVQATVWDVTADFSADNGNPNGAWTYGWMDVNFTTFTPFTTHGYTTGNSPYWDDTDKPIIWLNNGSPTSGVGTGQLSLHPGPQLEPSVARWTAPSGVSGSATIQGQFFPGDIGGTSVAVRINNSPIWTSTNSGSFDLTTSVVPGDLIDFAVYGGYLWGNTPLDAVITAVPEPISLALLTLGGLTLLPRRKA